MTSFRGKLRIRHLEIIQMVADRGNLSKAALQLDITQSGLSRAIAEIEELVGGSLFERSAKGMVCTPLGLVLCRHARVLLGDVDRAEADIDAVLHGDLGSITIGCFSMFSGWPLVDAVRLFRQVHPRVTVSIQIGTHEKLIGDLDSGAMDVLISRFTAALDPQIYRTVTLLRDPVVLTCALGHRLANVAQPSLAACVSFPWVTALPGSRIRGEMESLLRGAGLVVPGMVGALSLEFGMDMVADNLHLLTLPGSVAAVMQKRGRLRVLPVELALTRSPLAAIWRRDRPSTRQMRAFSAMLAKVIKAEGEAAG